MSSTTAKKSTKRGLLRFTSEENTMAWVSPDTEDIQMENSFLGLAVNESRNGVSVVIVNRPDIIVGQKYLVKVGRFDPAQAELRWIKKLDDAVIRLGFFFEDY